MPDKALCRASSVMPNIHISATTVAGGNAGSNMRGFRRAGALGQHEVLAVVQHGGPDSNLRHGGGRYRR